MHQLASASLALVVLLGLSPQPAVAAAAPQLSLGEVAVAAEPSAARALELSRELRAALADELRALAKSGVTWQQPLVVSATLTRFSSERRAKRTPATAAISLALLRARDRELLGELRGRASAEESSDSVAAVQQAALRAAVRGAVAHLPEAARRLR